MMKKIFLITVCCTILLAISPVAYSLDGQYVSGSIGFAKITDMNLTDRELFAVQHKDLEPDEGVALAVALGYRPYDMLRVEGEISYQENDIDQRGAYNVNGDVSDFALMVNGYFEPGGIEETGKFQPYIIFGIGWAKVKSDFTLRTEERYDPVMTLKYSNSDGTFAYQVGAGVGYAINEKITLDCKYRYQWCSELSYGTTDVEYNSHNIFVGIRYAF
jgi:opacity protein-like surface antigen